MSKAKVREGQAPERQADDPFKDVGLMDPKVSRRGFLKAAAAVGAALAMGESADAQLVKQPIKLKPGDQLLVVGRAVRVDMPKMSVIRDDEEYIGKGVADLRVGDKITVLEAGKVPHLRGVHRQKEGMYEMTDSFSKEKGRVNIYFHGVENGRPQMLGVIENGPPFRAEYNERRDTYDFEFKVPIEVPKKTTIKSRLVPANPFVRWTRFGPRMGYSSFRVQNIKIERGGNTILSDRHGIIEHKDQGIEIFVSKHGVNKGTADRYVGDRIGDHSRESDPDVKKEEPAPKKKKPPARDLPPAQKEPEKEETTPTRRLYGRRR